MRVAEKGKAMLGEVHLHAANRCYFFGIRAPNLVAGRWMMLAHQKRCRCSMQKNLTWPGEEAWVQISLAVHAMNIPLEALSGLGSHAW